MPTVKATTFLLGCAGILACAPTSAHALEGWFFGLDLARAKTQIESPGVGFALRDDKGTAYKLSAGYQLNSNWKAELSYLDFSKPPLTAANAFGQPVAQDPKGRGLQLSGTGTLSLTQKIGLYGRVGAFYSNLDSACTTNYLSCTAADRGTDLSLGVGVRYDFTKTVSVRGEWERFHKFGARDFTGQGDVDFFTVGMGVRF
jgi:OmpA-OmpF porin, OOP family